MSCAILFWEKKHMQSQKRACFTRKRWTTNLDTCWTYKWKCQDNTSIGGRAMGDQSKLETPWCQSSPDNQKHAIEWTHLKRVLGRKKVRFLRELNIIIKKESSNYKGYQKKCLWKKLRDFVFMKCKGWDAWSMRSWSTDSNNAVTV